MRYASSGLVVTMETLAASHRGCLRREVPPWRRHAKLSRPEHHALCYLAEIGGLVVRNAAIY